MTEEFDKQLMSIKDQLTAYRQKDEFKPDPSGSSTPSAIEAPKEVAEEAKQQCIAKKQQAGMTQEEAELACSGASGDAKDQEEEAPKEPTCVEKKISEGMSEEEAKAACAPKSEDSRWVKPYVGIRGNDNKYNQIVGPYATRGVTTDAKVAYDAKTGLWRQEE